MPVQKVTREEILQKSLQVFKRQGYHRTSMDDLAKACGLLKGSFYHYFSSKEALMKAVLQYMNEYNEANVLSIAYDESLLPRVRLERLLNTLFAAVTQTEGGCLMGNTVLETALVTEEFKETLQTHFNNIMAAAAHIYQTVCSPERAFTIAQQLAVEIQGSLLLIKLYGNSHLLDDCRARALQRFDDLQKSTQS